MAQQKFKGGTVTYEDHFMEIRCEWKRSEAFVALVNEKIQQGWNLVNALAVGSFSIAFLTK
jgi:hypothetical protein